MAGLISFFIGITIMPIPRGRLFFLGLGLGLGLGFQVLLEDRDFNKLIHDGFFRMLKHD